VRARLASDVDHRITVPFSGDAGGALAAAQTILAMLGYAVTREGSGAIDATGPGLRSTNQNPVLGASRLRIVASAGTLALEAEMGGVRSMRRFVWLFPPSLILGLILIFVMVGLLGGRGVPWTVLFPGGLIQLALWVVLAPFLAGWIDRRTRTALGTLLGNVARAG